MTHLNGTDLDKPLDDREAFRQMCNDYLRQYHSANVPAPQLDAPTRTALRVAGPQSWSQSPPTAPGWYWVWSGDEVWACQFFEDNGQIFHAIVNDYEPARHSGMAWLGPMAVPAPPKASQGEG